MTELSLPLCLAMLASVADPATSQGDIAFLGSHEVITPAIHLDAANGGAWHLDLRPNLSFFLLRVHSEASDVRADPRRWEAQTGVLMMYVDSKMLLLDDRSDPDTFNTAIPSEPLFVTLEGAVAPKEQIEGPMRLTVIPNRFDAGWLSEDCASDLGNLALIDTVWRIRSLRGEDLPKTPPAGEPFLILHSDQNQFSASVGCNTVLGRYSADGDLTFTPSMRTTMACDDDLVEWEARLGIVLAETKLHSITGRTLRLQDEKGAVVAELEAVCEP
jgi:heat shock protein HslJ